ncbi:hypothetical protein A6U87_27735 [Rhizobium sp. AC44/96]|uniref:hypothetical protein n=1 Tax=unclassified Rhizobium TaxID=2613769 RepID=UPI00081001F5|nr:MULTISPECIES: hypothetical protein [unclassified Rhizobium]MDM9623460.1 hypothetical protein [Rhizobium sp. S96]OCJ11106.1 hypothetical protein A6U87_27735 [Rhizobium sp. AC44/96]
MSSNHEYLEIADVKMLERVLERAGYYASLVDTSDTQYAAQFVLKLFQSGIDSEEDLVDALNARGKSAVEGATPRQVRLEAVNRWADERG